VLFSFFRKGTTTRRLILNFEMLELYAPAFCFEELKKYKETMYEKSAISDSEFEEIEPGFQTRG